MAKAKPEPLRADATDAEFSAAMDRHRNLVFPLRKLRPLMRPQRSDAQKLAKNRHSSTA